MGIAVSTQRINQERGAFLLLIYKELNMFFTKTAIIVAWIIFLLGIILVIFGFAATAVPDQPYFTSTGKTIDKGLLLIFLGIALGVLAEISNHFAKGLS